MRKNLPDIFLLTVGLLVMALLMYLIALSHGWITWYRHLVNLAFRNLGVDPDDEDDLPSFPG